MSKIQSCAVKNVLFQPVLYSLIDVCEFAFSDFELSDAQQEHALAVERLAPRLAALRMEFCPGHMSESYFWKIYFVLLHPRLNKHDAELLTTPQVSWFCSTDLRILYCFHKYCCCPRDVLMLDLV